MFFVSENDKCMDIESINRIIESECTTLYVKSKQIHLEKKTECTSTSTSKSLYEMKKKPYTIKIMCKKSKYSIS